MKTISIVISTYNRAESLKRTLLSVKSFADEIIIVDNSSVDNTQEIAKKFTKKVFVQKNNVKLNINKNFGIEKATSDWVFYLDDDEVVTEELLAEIKIAIESDNDVLGFWIPRKNIIFGKWIEHGIWSPDNQMRLFKRGSGKYPGIHVHEYISVLGKTGNLHQHLVHYNYESIDQYLFKMQTLYIQSEVEKLTAESYVVHWYDAVRFPLSDFLKVYFAQSGWKDGLHGLVLANLQAFYSFLVFAKLWEKSSFQQTPIAQSQLFSEMHRSISESTYWMWTTFIAEESSIFGKLKGKIMRRLYGHV